MGIVAAAGVAFGCDPAVAEHLGGLAVLRAMHRLQWLMIGVTVLSGLGLAALVVFERRRAWWLLGLLPVVALFGWRFGAAGERLSLWVEDQPTFASAQQSTWLTDEDPVIGLEIDGQAFAYPIAALRRAPVVVQGDRARRLIVAWSAGARAASAAWVDRAVRGRDLEVVAAPTGVLLIYNRRVGVFFDALTLRDPSGRPAEGMLNPIPTVRTTWQAWRAARPETMVLQPRWTPVREADPTSANGEHADGVALLRTDPPIAVPMAAITAEPQNYTAGAAAVLVFRDDSGGVRAFDRRLEQDLFPRFSAKTDRKTQRRVLADADTGTTWTFAGAAVEGPLKGTSLTPILVQPDLSPDSVRFWLPDAVFRPAP